MRDGLPSNAVWRLFSVPHRRNLGCQQLRRGTTHKPFPVEVTARFTGITKAQGLTNPVGVGTCPRMRSATCGSELSRARVAKSGFTIYNERDGLNRDSVVALFEDRGGRLQALTRKRGIVLNTWDGQRFKPVQPRCRFGISAGPPARSLSGRRLW